MDRDVAALENKLDQFLAHFEKVRAENRALRERMAGLEVENKALADRIQTARTRLEALMQRLPEE
jgi:cell division protein ZapB